MLPWIVISWYCWYWYIVLPVRLVFVYCRYTWYYNWYIILLVLLYCWYIVLPGIPGIAAGISYCWCWYIACILSCRYCLVYLVLPVWYAVIPALARDYWQSHLRITNWHSHWFGCFSILFWNSFKKQQKGDIFQKGCFASGHIKLLVLFLDKNKKYLHLNFLQNKFLFKMWLVDIFPQTLLDEGRASSFLRSKSNS